MLQKRHNVENVLLKNLPAWLVACMIACVLLFLGGLIYSCAELVRAMAEIGKQLVELGWGRTYNVTHPLLVFGACLGDGTCAPGANKALERAIPYVPFLASVMPLALAAGLFGRYATNPNVKMPGQQRWAVAEDAKIKLYTEGDQERPENRRSGYMGYFMAPAGPEKFDLSKLKMMMPPVEDRCTNTIIISGVGGGKTSGLFIPQLMTDAIQGNSVILFDLKYPNKRGFYNMIAFWHRLGRNIQLFTPFSEDTLHMPLLDAVVDRKTALEVAESLITPPEHQNEVGAHYKNVARDTLASIMLAVANHPVPSKRTFREVLRVAQSTKTELEHWYKQESANNPEIKEAMKGLFDRSAAANADMLRSLVADLKIFFDPILERATTSSAGRNLNLHQVFREPTLLYIGIEQEHIENGSGEALIKLIKRLIDRIGQQEAARVGGVLPIHVEYLFDEFASFGKIGNMLRSTGTNRERNIGMTLGVQNSSQGRLVYGELLYAAMTDNVMGHTILLPYGITGKDAIYWSELLGTTTRVVPTEGVTRDALMPNPFNARRTQGVKVEKQAFLPPEEFATYTKNEGVLIMMGCPPVRIKLPRYDALEVVKGGRWGRKSVPNRIAQVYRNVMGDTAPGVLTDQLLADPTFRLKGRAMTSETLPDTPEAMLHAWADAALEQGAKVRLVRASTPHKVYIEIASFSSPLAEDQVTFLVDQSKWLARGAAGTELRITDTGQALLGEAKMQRFLDSEVVGPIVRWMRQRAQNIEHHPVRESLPDDQRQEAMAYYEFETLAMPSTDLRELLGVVPELPTRRVGTRNLVVVPLNDPARLREAVEKAREKAAQQNAGEATGWGKTREVAAAQLPLPKHRVLNISKGSGKSPKGSKPKSRGATLLQEAAHRQQQEADDIALTAALDQAAPVPPPVSKKRNNTPAAPLTLFLPLPQLQAETQPLVPEAPATAPQAPVSIQSLETSEEAGTVKRRRSGPAPKGDKPKAARSQKKASKPADQTTSPLLSNEGPSSEAVTPDQEAADAFDVFKTHRLRSEE
ncbi:type IV secretion system DNA-binding domain-containing protein [Deinococcus sp. HMF7620]|uniref:Type IV secretion system DNA-binding domain-containing protein n=1 Tax=Deinococcus arboris TaxID=2682977 RepID=A0A7C9M702_9DEIO|nr:MULTISPECIES: type IV secretory system conjugative DNA transfer family protein [Deinococcus]MBZ9752201.1 type IV secretory system conjugative DNA transfer family protein [Deinococcus betulae]MVN87545.1 type IV secretion system DNA-binding domain-containing protein [Deinococcus arboris]